MFGSVSAARLIKQCHCKHLADILKERCAVRCNNVKQLRKFASVNRGEKLSYFHRIGNEPLQYETLGNLLEASANKWPDRHAIVSIEENVTITYSELLQKADELAASFIECGIERGDRVGIWAPNCWAWQVVNYAAMRAGFVLVSMNPLYQKSELALCINKVGMKAIVMLESSSTLNFYETICSIAPELRKCEPGSLTSKNVPTLKTVVVLSDKELPGTFNYKSLTARANPRTTQRISSGQHLVQAEDICNIQFTSGTTSDPKAVLLTHMGYYNGANILGKLLSDNGDYIRHCVQLPFFHVFASVCLGTSGIKTGATLYIPSVVYNPKMVYRTIRDYGCTYAFGTPTMFVDMLRTAEEEGGNPPESLRYAFSGGAPSSPHAFQTLIKKLNLDGVLTGFGMTESNSIGFVTPLDMVSSRTEDTVGYLMDHLQVKIIDENGKVVPMGQPGELCIKGFCVMKGYLNDEKKTKEVLDIDGWLKTGDQAILSDDGRARIVGRIKDIIIRGGENIYPKEVEDIINQHENVLEVHVFGVSDDRLGEAVCAAIRTRDGAALTSEQIAHFCSGKLSKYKIPKHVRVVSDFPKTASGKIQKFKLRNMMEGGTL